MNWGLLFLQLGLSAVVGIIGFARGVRHGMRLMANHVLDLMASKCNNPRCTVHHPQPTPDDLKDVPF